MKRTFIITLTVLSVLPPLNAQQILSIEDCRELAVSNNKDLEQARLKSEMADCDKKIALANYFPKISASGTYMYNSNDLSFVSDETSAILTSLGTTVQDKLGTTLQPLISAFMSNPSAQADPMWRTLIGTLSRTDMSTALNSIGADINDALHFDIHNVYAGVVSIQQPVFMGGKIVASNQMAQLAKELAQTEYDEKLLTVEMEAESTYWQIVSLAAKDRLASSYLELLDRLQKDAEISVAEGVAVQSDLLAVKVKRNEAAVLKTKTGNGLVLSKMLMCKQLGLPLDSDIKLKDEDDEAIDEAAYVTKRDMEEILMDRNETKMLDLASRIYEKKVSVARADQLPKIALTGNYLITNPNFNNGYNTKFGDMFNVGVMVSIPIFHAAEGYQRIQKAKAESAIYKSKYEDACRLINVQVEQLSRSQDEALENLNTARSNMDCADENLRTAMIGFSEGVISSDVALQAQTAWVKARTEYIDAGIEVQMNRSRLLKAQGLYR